MHEKRFELWPLIDKVARYKNKSHWRLQICLGRTIWDKCHSFQRHSFTKQINALWKIKRKRIQKVASFSKNGIGIISISNIGIIVVMGVSSVDVVVLRVATFRNQPAPG